MDIGIKFQYMFYNLFATLFFIITILIWKYRWKIQIPGWNTILILLLINLILVFTSDSFLIKHSFRDKIGWTNNISFDKFKVDTIINKHAAEISTGFYSIVNKVYNYPPAIVVSTMTPKESWVRQESKNNKYDLYHEQYHFNITEFIRLKLSDSINNYWFIDNSKIDSIIKYFGLYKNKLQNDYDTFYFYRDTTKLYPLISEVDKKLNLKNTNGITFQFIFKRNRAFKFQNKIAELCMYFFER